MSSPEGEYEVSLLKCLSILHLFTEMKATFDPLAERID